MFKLFADRPLHEGFVLASQSRCGYYRLESRVRENRMHSSEGAEDVRPFRPLSTAVGLRLAGERGLEIFFRLAAFELHGFPPIRGAWDVVSCGIHRLFNSKTIAAVPTRLNRIFQ